CPHPALTIALAPCNKVKDIENDELLWGDELEYGIFLVDQQEGTVKLSLRSAEILETLKTREFSVDGDNCCQWVPEYGAWMVEGTPARPYSGFASDLLRVEPNMRIRRARLVAALKPDEICPTIPCFPLMGVGEFTEVRGGTPRAAFVRQLSSASSPTVCRSLLLLQGGPWQPPFSFRTV
ncbi:MAG: hypothetical protein SGPRY_014665, partial [Prymnesium sp.]